MKKLIIIIAIVMIFVLFMGNLNKIDNLISDISSEIEESTKAKDTTAPGTSSGDGTGSVTKYHYNIQLRESGTNKYITTFELDSTKNVAYFSVDSSNDIWLKAADGAQIGLDTEGWTNIVLSETTVYPTTLTVYVNYTSTNTGGDSTGNGETPHTHSYTTTTAATCLIAGVKSCSCGATQAIAALGHSWGEDYVSKEATCTNYGVMSSCCSNCGEVDNSGAIEPLGHNYVNGVCSRCGASK